MDRDDVFGVVFVVGFVATLFVLQAEVVPSWIVLPVAAVGMVGWLWRWATADE